MRVVKVKDVAKEPFPSNIFNGPDVNRQLLTPGSQDFDATMVNFGRDTRTRFHTHTSDQLLIVTSGTGIVATKQEQHVVTVGDVILIPAGEAHLHGAAEDSEFSHIAVTRTGSKLALVEK